MPGSPVDQHHRAGLPRAGHRRHGDLGLAGSPYLCHKVNFLVVVFGIPIIAVALAIGWRLVRPAVVENTGDRLKAVWSDDGPTYGPGVSPDDLDVAEHDPATAGRDLDGPELRRQLRAA